MNSLKRMRGVKNVGAYSFTYLLTIGIAGFGVKSTYFNRENEHDPNRYLRLWNADKEQKWYKKQVTYWDKQPTTVDGVLGGYGNTSEIELKFFHEFLKKNIKHDKKDSRAFDVGAGIGRITKLLLLDHFKEVDLLDQSQV